MAAMTVGDLREQLSVLPPDARIVIPDYDWDTDKDRVWSVDKGVSWDEENNEIVLYKGDVIRSEDA